MVWVYRLGYELCLEDPEYTGEIVGANPSPGILMYRIVCEIYLCVDSLSSTLGG